MELGHYSESVNEGPSFALMFFGRGQKRMLDNLEEKIYSLK